MRLSHIKNIRLCLISLLFVCNSTVFAQCPVSFTSIPSSLEICDNQSIQFTLSTTSIISQRVWNFGDGTPTSGSTNPSHVFNTTKDTTYKVLLLVRCSNGQRDSSKVNVKVFSRPKSDFSMSKSDLCAITDSSCFTNLSINKIGTTYLWDFGDLESSTNVSTCHKYFTNGTFQVELRAIRPANQGGCQQKSVKTLTVKETPNPDFELDPSNGCLPFSTTIVNNTQNAITISNWEWDFGDGTSFLGNNPTTKSYSNSGNYTVKLTVSNTIGCTNTTQLPVFVSNAPTLSVSTPPNVCPNVPVTITAITNATSPIYTWNTAGGQIISGNNTNQIVAKWATGGTKNISLDLDQGGCVVSRSVIGYVFPETNLIANYPNGNSVCEGSSIDVEILPATMPLYTFYKGNNILLQTSIAGIKLINLKRDTTLNVRIKDANNCTFSGAIVGNVTPYPVLTITALPSNNICPNTNTTISVLPTGLSNYLFLRNFNFAQSGTGSNFSATNFLQNDRIHAIANKNGCADTSSSIKINILNDIKIPPIANCGNSDNSGVQFVWTSVPGISTYQVSVDNGLYIAPSSGSLGLSHSVSGLNQGQNVTIKVMAIRNGLCADTVYSEIITCTAINCNAKSFRLINDTLFCEDDNITFFAKKMAGITAAYQFNWNGTITKDSVYTTKAKNVLTLPGSVLTVKLEDSTFDPCPSFTQISYGINIISVPSLVVNYTRNANSCAKKDSIFVKCEPANLDEYEYFLDNIKLQNEKTPILNLALTDTLVHTLKVRGIQNTCVGEQFSTITFKGINFPKYEVEISGPKTACGISKPNGTKEINLTFTTKSYLKVLVAGDTTFITPDTVQLFLDNNTTPEITSLSTITNYTGSAKSSRFYSKIKYKGCLFESKNNVDVTVVPGPPKPILTPINFGNRIDGLVEQTCTNNKFHYRISPSIPGVDWSVDREKSSKTTRIMADTSNTFFANVSALGSQSSNPDLNDTILHTLARQVYDGVKNKKYDDLFSNFKANLATVSGLSTEDINKFAKKSADSLLYVIVNDSIANTAKTHAKDTILFLLIDKETGCKSEETITFAQTINFHSIIEADTKSCYYSKEFTLPFLSINLTKPTDTITFSLNYKMITPKPYNKIIGEYFQTIDPKESAKYYPNPSNILEKIPYKSTTNTFGDIKVLPPIVFTGYYPANHTIRVSNQNGCYMDYSFKTEENKTSKTSVFSQINICKGDFIDGTIINDTILNTYNYWNHPFVSKEAAANKYIFKPNTPINEYQSIMISCDAPDSTGSCCVFNTLSGCTMDCDEMQYIPNAISPNGDNVNDTWKIYGLRNPKVEIYNRWGELIFQANKYMNDWNGKAQNGVDFPDGVYTYIVYPQGEFSMNNQTTHHFAGITPEDYKNQNKNSTDETQINPFDPINGITKTLPNFDQIPDAKYLDPKTKAAMYFCKKISFNELKGTLIIQR